MSKRKGKNSTKTSALRVVGVYNRHEEGRCLRLIDFVQANSELANPISAQAEEEEVRRLKAESDQRVEEFLAKVEPIKQYSGRKEVFPTLAKSMKNDEYFGGTKMKKIRKRRKKNREEIIMSLEECQNTVSVSEKNSNLAHSRPQPSYSCWQDKAGATLFESPERQYAEDVDNWALNESLREQQEEQKRFMEILAGSYTETKRKLHGMSSFLPPKPVEEECWDSDEKDYTDAKESTESSKTEDKFQAEINIKQRNKGSESKGAGNTVSNIYTTTTTNDKSIGLYVNGDQRNGNGAEYFYRTPQQMNKLVSNLSEKLKPNKAQSSDINKSYTCPYQIKRKQTHGRTYLQHVDLENNARFEGESRHCMQKVSESLKSKSNTAHRQEGVIKSVKLATHCETLNPLERTSEQKYISQSEVNDISQYFSTLNVEKEPMRSWEEGKLTHQNSAVANEVQTASRERLTSSSLPNKVAHQVKTQESGTANMQHVTQAREQQSQQLSGSTVPQSIWSPFSAQGVSASAEHHKLQKQSLPSQSVPGQSLSPDSYASLMEELQKIRMYQNLLIQLNVQENLQVKMQQWQTVFHKQHQPDFKALLQQQIQNDQLYASIVNLLQSQNSDTELPNSKNISEHSQTPSINPGSPNNVAMVQKHFQGILQQQELQQQHPSTLLHVGFPGAVLTQQQQQQQQNDVTQPGPQASTTAHSSLQRSYSIAPQSDFVGPRHYLSPMSQQYAPNIQVAKPPAPQSLTGLPLNPTTTNAALPPVEETKYLQSMLLQQQYALSLLACLQSPQHLTGPPPNMNPMTNAAVSPLEAAQYPQSILLQQQYASSLLACPQSPHHLTGAPPNMNPTTNAAVSPLEAAQYPQSILLQQQYAPNILASLQSSQSLTAAPPNMNPTATNVDMSAMETAQLTVGMYNQQPAQHTMAGVVPLVPQEKPKSKSRGRIIRQIESHFSD